METVCPAWLGKLLLSAKFQIQPLIDRLSSISLFIFMSPEKAGMAERLWSLYKNNRKTAALYCFYKSSSCYEEKKEKEFFAERR